MKSLQNYILENTNLNESEESKTITFDFKDLENGEDTLKSFEDKEYCTIDDDKLTVTVTKDNADKLGTIQDILQQFSDTIRNSTKRTNDEQYAQLTKKFENNVEKLNDAIDEITNSEEE